MVAQSQPVSDSSIIDEYYIDDVLVTANKRSEKLSEVPASISTLNGLQKDRQGIETLNDLTFTTPGLHMPDYGSSLTSPIYIRGIGSRINEPAVALYVDDIPYFEKAAFDFNLFDIERIEVLRGPQGTLYGRNSLGGIIKMYTSELKAQPATNLSAGYGSHDRKQIHFRQNLPFSQKMLFSLSANYMNHNGYYTNHYESNTIGGKEDLSGRVKLSYRPADNARLEVIVDAKNTRNNGYPYARSSQNADGGQINYNHESYYKRDILSTGLKAEIDMGGYSLKSVSSFQLLDDLQDIDQDFSPQDMLYVYQDRQHHLFAQEINLSSPNDRRLEFIAGLFGFLQLRDKEVDVFYGPEAVTTWNLPGEMHKNKIYDKTTGGFAAFGQLSYEDFILPDMTATLGLRYDHEFNKLDYRYLLYMNDREIPQDDFVHQKSYPEVLPKASLHYRWNDQIVQYISFTKGYKSGGFNSTFEKKKDQTFKPEYSLNYETGLKWSGDFLSAQFSAYHIDVKDKQVYQIDTLSHGPLLKNAGEAYSRGVELELTHRSMKNWINRLSFGWTDARYDQYVKDPAENIDYGGNYMPYIPRFTFSVASNYRMVFSNSFLNELQIHASYNGIGEHYWNDENTLKEGYYGLVNLRAGFVFDRLECVLWTKNALDRNYNVFMFQAFNNTYSQRSAPFRFGLTLKSTLNFQNLIK
jgi:outer membrane receptor protein involved in Fe transport